MFKSRRWLWATTALLIGVGLLIGCGGGGGGGSDDTPVLVNLAGIWQVEETVDGDCSGNDYPYSRIMIYTVTQSGNSVTMRDDLEDEEMTATLSGYTLSIDDTLPNGDGSITITGDAECSTDGRRFSGTATWTYTEPGYSCSGTRTLTGTKTSDARVDAGGDWSGTYDSDEYGVSDTFSATIVDTDGVLTGTISVPFIGMSDAVLTGTVDGSAITFGDISGQITFTGVITESGTASGSYAFDSLGDEGTWEAHRL